MKKIFYLFAVAAFVLAGCEGGDNPDPNLPERYAIDVTDDGHGSVVVTVDGKTATKASEGVTVLLTAKPWRGYLLSGWAVVKGEVLLLPDAVSDPVEFKMPAGDVSVRADFIKYSEYVERKGGVVIDGVGWATANVDKPGTFAAKPEDTGMFYQWGRKVGWSTADPMVNSDGGTAWNKSYVSADSWPSIDSPCPEGWRVPTMSELEKLVDNIKVVSIWTTQNGVNGRLFTDTVTDKSMFLPAVGSRFSILGTLDLVGFGCYWSVVPLGTGSAYYLGFNDNSTSPSFNTNPSSPTRPSDDQNAGFSVRCVLE